MNNDMLAAAIIWAAQEELKQDGKRIKRAAVGKLNGVVKTFSNAKPESYAIQALRSGLTVDQAVEIINNSSVAITEEVY